MDVCEADVCEELANLQARPDESEVRRFFLLPPRSISNCGPLRISLLVCCLLQELCLHTLTYHCLKGLQCEVRQ
jgi:hypothetical protein